MDLFAKIPKTDLHVHLSGSAPLALIREFLREKGWSETKIREQTRLKDHYQSLNDFLEVYYRVPAHVQTPDHFRRAAAAIVKEAAQENVRYLEIRSSIFGKNSDNPREIVSAIEAGMAEGEAWVRENLGFAMTTRLIVLAQRAGTPEQSMKAARWAVRLSKEEGSRIVGFDIGGSEKDHWIGKHAEALKYIKDNGLKLTVHAGETAVSGEQSGVASIREAVALGADRIGHGLQLVKDKLLMKQLAKQGVHVESAPWSNVQLSNVAGYAGHPLPEFLKNKLSVSLNTDNRMMSQITQAEQLAHLYKTGVLTCWNDIKRLSYNGIRGAFIGPLEKFRLTRQFKKAFNALEKQPVYRTAIQKYLHKGCGHRKQSATG